jgi:pimeloyl-ACP methyl ester carboxylesterase
MDGHMSALEMPETQYARSGDLSIAYQAFGEGPIDIVFVSGFISHIEMQWEMPLAMPVHALSRFGRLIMFDKRGTGLSDRDLGFGTPEDRMDDIRAVMDAESIERAAVIGLSEGAPLALLFAATYPQRVDALVLWASYARYLAADDYPIGTAGPEARRFIDWVGENWGKGHALESFIHIAPGDEETRRLVARYERNAATPKMAAEILRNNLEIDVRSALPAISARTLVLHRRRDPIVPFRFGQYVAEHIAGARFVELPGDFHFSSEPNGEDATVETIVEFLTGEEVRAPAHIDRVLATVLFVDIVDSTKRVAALGDQKWRELLDRFRGAVRRELERFRGREVNTRGDDFLATFDGPARAIACARAIEAAAKLLGVEVRAGLHTGEVELQGNDVAGMAVHIGARVAALANANEVLVTSTVRDLVLGSGIEFAPRGSHELKGVPGEWLVLEVV